MPFTGKKLQVLYQYASLVGNDPGLMFAVGVLAGAVERVHFVKDVTDAPVAIEMSAGRVRIWPAEPFKATVGGVSIPDPTILASALAGNDDPICIRLRNEDIEQTEAFLEIVVEDYNEVATGRDTEVQITERRLTDLRAEIDHALDVYSECKALMQATNSGERQAELRTYLHMAEQELKRCTQELTRLEHELNEEREQWE